MIGKFAISASFGMVRLYTLEAYPTSIRSLGLNMSSTFARFASVPASYVGMLVRSHYFLAILNFVSDFFLIIDRRYYVCDVTVLDYSTGIKLTCFKGSPSCKLPNFTLGSGAPSQSVGNK